MTTDRRCDRRELRRLIEYYPNSRQAAGAIIKAGWRRLPKECTVCHDAAAGHTRWVPFDHDCAGFMHVINCAECDQ